MGTYHRATRREPQRAAAATSSALRRSSVRFCPSLRARFYCVHDRMISSAAAIIAGEMRADLFAARNATAAQQFLRGQQHAWRAITALQRVTRDEGLLQIRDLLGIGDPLHGIPARAVPLHPAPKTAAYHP